MVNWVVNLTTEQLVRLFRGRRSGKGKWLAKCPVHRDRSPSLMLTGHEGKTGIHCFRGCAKADVLAAKGLTLRDLFSDGVPDRQALALAERQRARELLERKTQRRQAWVKWEIARKWEACRNALGLLLIQQPGDSKLASLFHWACVRSRELEEAMQEICRAYGFRAHAWLDWDTPPRPLAGITSADVGAKIARYLRLP